VFVVSPLKPVGSAAATTLAHLAVIATPATMVAAIMATMLGANPTPLLLILSLIVMARPMGTLFGPYVYGRPADPLKTSSTASPLNLLLMSLLLVMYLASILSTAIQLASVAVPTVPPKLVTLQLIRMAQMYCRLYRYSRS